MVSAPMSVSCEAVPFQHSAAVKRLRRTYRAQDKKQNPGQQG